LHFQGSFEEQGEKAGAKTFYLQCRIPNATLFDLEGSLEAQQRMGMTRGEREGEAMWKARLLTAQFFQTQAKQHASYWLGLVQYEEGDFAAAASWFKERTLELYPDGNWTPGARYNLARTYEALGDTQRARELYLEDDSPQQHGNLIRAKQLAQETGE
jgi:tetratricopeptide (TPR) repeat protein